MLPPKVLKTFFLRPLYPATPERTDHLIQVALRDGRTPRQQTQDNIDQGHVMGL